jgi:hypothetical protein
MREKPAPDTVVPCAADVGALHACTAARPAYGERARTASTQRSEAAGRSIVFFTAGHLLSKSVGRRAFAER